MFIIRSSIRALAVTVGAIMIFATSSGAMAATASGIVIANTASVDYEVGGLNQTDVISNSVDFTVDAKVDLTVAGTGGNLNISPGASGQVLHYTVHNTGNEMFDYSLAFTADAGDNFNATAVAVYVDANGNNTYDPGIDTATSIDNLAADITISVFVVGDIPLSVTDTQVATYHLRATTLLSTGLPVPAEPASDTEDSKDYVYADTQGTDTANDIARDKIHSASLDYVVQSATIDVAKSNSVDDGLTGPTGEFYIPGGTVTYTITVTNNGGTDADNVVLADAAPTDTTYVADSVTLNTVSKTDAADIDEVTVVAGVITVNVGTLASGGGSATVTFDVTID
ncbi:hypothetical protein MNBD_GAMMA18-777 [hydrothermal vent metagenome]|uniref:DUF11 domain-containing protein n=1 Tax=hydrothermal vent metagenome TaxID=652676 RepID=A0A3B0ZP42_9ZZZZ